VSARYFHDLTVAAEVAFSALREVGRDDLATEMLWFQDEAGPYVEVDALMLGAADWALVDRAEALARQSIGMPPRARPEMHA
jgi:hypothetical protein